MNCEAYLKCDLRVRQARQWVVERLEKCLPADYHYHNLDHTLDVTARATQYADLEGLDPEEYPALLTAALFHDTGFTVARDDCEARSVELCRQAVEPWGYADAQLRQIGALIMATRLPQRPATLAERILCDADLDYLGREDYFMLSSRLRREWENFGLVLNEREWLEKQLDFLKAHRYFLPAAERRRGELKAFHIRELEKQHAAQSANSRG